MAPRRRPVDRSAAAPALTPAELAAAARDLAIVARCPIARLPRTGAPPGVRVPPETDAQGRRRLTIVLDGGRLLHDGPVSEVIVDDEWLAGLEVTRRRKSAEAAERCAGCLAGRTCRAAAAQAAPVAIRTRGGLSLLG